MQIRAICRYWSVLSKKQMLATSLLYIVVVNLGLSSLKCDLHSVFLYGNFVLNISKCLIFVFLDRSNHKARDIGHDGNIKRQSHLNSQSRLEFAICV